MSRSILHHSRIVSLLTLVSRVTGLLRDVVLAAWLGNNWIQDCYNYAFAIPNLFRQLFGEGALSSAFMPLLTGKMAGDDPRPAQRFLSVTATALALVLGLMTLAVGGLVLAIAVFGSPERVLLLRLTALMSPYMIFVCLTALFAAVLHCQERFALPAFMPVVLNVFQIGAVAAVAGLGPMWLAEQRDQILLVGAAVLGAGVVQLGVMVRATSKLGWRWRFDLRLWDADLRRLVTMMMPMVLGLGVLQVTAWLDNHLIVSLTATEGHGTFRVLGREIAYPLAAGTMSSVHQARRLYQLPLGVLGLALATVAFPVFSKLAAADDKAALGRKVRETVRLGMFQAMPCLIVLVVYGDLMVKVLFEYGEYNRADTARTAHVLRFYSLGMGAYFVHHVLLRAFYSLRDTRTPLRILAWTAPGALAVNVAGLWVEGLGAGVFGLSTSVMMGLNVVLLGRRLKRRLPSYDCPLFSGAHLRLLLAGLVALAGAMGGRLLPVANAYVHLLLGILIVVILFGASGYFLRIPELGETIRAFLFIKRSK